MGFRRIALDAQGFSLVQVMIAMGVMGGLALMMSTMISGSQKATRSIAMSVDWTTTVQNLNLIFAHEKSCAQTNLIGMQIDPSAPFIEKDVVRLQHSTNYSDLINQDKFIVKAGEEKPLGILTKSVKITSMSPIGSFAQPAPLPPLQGYLATLLIEAEKVNGALDKVVNGNKTGGVVGRRDLKHEMRLHLLLETVAPGVQQVKKCYSEISAEALCSSIENYQWVVDPVSGLGKCKRTNYGAANTYTCNGTGTTNATGMQFCALGANNTYDDNQYCRVNSLGGGNWQLQCNQGGGSSPQVQCRMNCLAE